jgi:hypothetical protein
MGRGPQRVSGTLGHRVERDPAQDGPDGLGRRLGSQRLEVDGALRQPPAQRNTGRYLINRFIFQGPFSAFRSFTCVKWVFEP